MKILEKTIAYAGRWLNMNRTRFITKTGSFGVWEHVSRPIRMGETDGVSILATITHENMLKLVAISIFRVPLNQWVLELPSGAINKNDKDASEAALRELKEETGYTAFVQNIKENHMIVYNDPWKSDECVRIVRIHIDEKLPENKNPKQNLDNAELINVELIPVRTLKTHLDRLVKEKGYAVDSRVYLFAMGLGFNAN